MGVPCEYAMPVSRAPGCPRRRIVGDVVEPRTPLRWPSYCSSSRVADIPHDRVNPECAAGAHLLPIGLQGSGARHLPYQVSTTIFPAARPSSIAVWASTI